MSGHRDSQAPTPATEQPGNSFKYLYWRLSEKEFQQLCSALLRLKYSSVRCFPVGMADEGIDAIADGDVIFQVKWSSKLLQDPAAWLEQAIAGERSKIARLVWGKRISRYILVTSVAGTTTSKGTGSIQKLQKQLDMYSREFGIPVECWWQSDIDAEVDAAPDPLKWSYQEMLAGADAVRYLNLATQEGGQAARAGRESPEGSDTEPEHPVKTKAAQIWFAIGVLASLATILSFIYQVAVPSSGQRAESATETATAQAPATASSSSSISVPSTSPRTSQPQSLTAGSVRQALLNLSDLAVIDTSLKAADIQPPSSSAPSTDSCGGGTTYPVYSSARLFKDGETLVLAEEIDAFPSQEAARNAFAVDSRTAMCGFSSPREITSTVAGLCDEGYAAEVLDTESGYSSAAMYTGILRCGRLVITAAMWTPSDGTFDQVGTFAQYAAIAVPKVLNLPGSHP